MFKSVAGDQPGGFSVFESTSAPGSGAGLHRHETYDEMHIVVEGCFEFQLGSDILQLGAGGMVYMPKGVPHSTKNIGPGSGRQLVISSPAGIFEAFIAEVTASQVDSGRPSTGPATDFRTIAAKYGVEFIDAPSPKVE